MPTNPMLSALHMGIVDAHKYGVTRDDATFTAALAAIGSAPLCLLLPNTGDGVWTLNNNYTIPTNVVLLLPPGTSIAGATHLNIQGQFVALGPAPLTAAGPHTLAFTPTYMGAVFTQRLGINRVAAANYAIDVLGDATWIARIKMQDNQGTSIATLDFFNGPDLGTERASIGLQGNSDLSFFMLNGARTVFSGGNVGIGMAPNFQFQLNTPDGYKSTGTTWLNPSDPRLKEDVEPFLEGVELLQHITPIYYRLKAGAGYAPSPERVVGVDAAALQQDAPALVGSYRGTLTEGGEETDILTFKGMDNVIYALVNTVKDLVARVAALEGRLPGGTPPA